MHVVWLLLMFRYADQQRIRPGSCRITSGSQASPACRKYPGTTIVTDSVTSNGLHSYIQERGGKHLRYRRGYKNIISKGVELNQQGTSCELMMETRHAHFSLVHAADDAADAHSKGVNI